MAKYIFPQEGFLEHQEENLDLWTQLLWGRWTSMYELPQVHPDWVCCKSKLSLRMTMLWDSTTDEHICRAAMGREHREQICGHSGPKETVGPTEKHRSTHYTSRTVCQWEFPVRLRELKPGLCDNIEGEMGWGVGGRFKREENARLLWLDSCGMAEPTQCCKQTILLHKIIKNKNKLNKKSIITSPRYTVLLTTV